MSRWLRKIDWPLAFFYLVLVLIGLPVVLLTTGMLWVMVWEAVFG